MAGNSTDIVLATGRIFFISASGNEDTSEPLIANPVLAGALIGVFLLCSLCLNSIGSMRQMASLTDISSHHYPQYCRVVAVLMVATAAGLLTMVAYYPTGHKMGHIFELSYILPVSYLDAPFSLLGSLLQPSSTRSPQ